LLISLIFSPILACAGDEVLKVTNGLLSLAVQHNISGFDMVKFRQDVRSILTQHGNSHERIDRLSHVCETHMSRTSKFYIDAAMLIKRTLENSYGSGVLWEEEHKSLIDSQAQIEQRMRQKEEEIKSLQKKHYGIIEGFFSEYGEYQKRCSELENLEKQISELEGKIAAIQPPLRPRPAYSGA